MGRKSKTTSSENGNTSYLGQMLRQIRQEKSLSLSALAEILGYTKGYLSSIENCKVAPSNELLKIYELKLGFSSGELTKHLRTEIPNDLFSTDPTKPLATIRNIPFLRNRFFTGRQEILNRLRTTLTVPKQILHACIISGLGGIGKTQIALEYLHQYRKSYRAIFWMKADSHQTLLSCIVDSAKVVNIVEKNREQTITKFINWLKNYNDEYLVIIDGLDNPDDINFTYNFISQISSNNSHIIITSRLSSSMQEISCIQIEQMNIEESILFLLRRIELISYDSITEDASVSDRNDACNLVRQLAGLPLALEQAGTFIKETQCTITSYLELYKTHHMDLLYRHNDPIAEYNQSVATTWSLSFQRIENANSAAADLLRACAFLYHSIPEEVVTTGASELGSNFEDIAANPFKINIAIGELIKYSFLQRNPSEKLLTIHPIVQTVLRDTMDWEVQSIWMNRIYKAVNKAFPFSEEDYQMNRPRYTTPFAEATLLLSFTIQEQLQEAENMDTAIRLSDLANLYRFQTNYEKSEELFQKSLKMQENLVGHSDRRIALTFNRLARLYRAKGQNGDSELMYKKAIEIQEKILEPTHPDLAKSLQGLAKLYKTLGKYALAEELLDKALFIHNQNLGPVNFERVRTLYTLAEIYESQKIYDKAEILYKQSLDLCRNIIGDSASHTGLVINKLAEMYCAQGKYLQAEPLIYQSLKIREENLGEDHPYIAFNFDILGIINYAKGDYAKAEELYKKALDLRERKDSKHAHITHKNLAKLYETVEKYDLSNTHYKTAIEYLTRICGFDHPDVITLLEHHVQFLRNSGYKTEAETAELKLIALQKGTD